MHTSNDIPSSLLFVGLVTAIALEAEFIMMHHGLVTYDNDYYYGGLTFRSNWIRDREMWDRHQRELSAYLFPQSEEPSPAQAYLEEE